MRVVNKKVNVPEPKMWGLICLEIGLNPETLNSHSEQFFYFKTFNVVKNGQLEVLKERMGSSLNFERELQTDDSNKKQGKEKRPNNK